MSSPFQTSTEASLQTYGKYISSVFTSVLRTVLQGELDRLGNISFIASNRLSTTCSASTTTRSPRISRPPTPFQHRQHTRRCSSPTPRSVPPKRTPSSASSSTSPLRLAHKSQRHAPTTSKVYPHPPLVLPNGGYHNDCSIYWVQQGNFTTPSAVVQMDPLTLASVVLNNFHGYRFNSLDDIVIRDSTFYPVLATGVYAWHPATGAIRSVANSDDGSLQKPNGLALTPDLRSISVADWGPMTASGPHPRFEYDIGPGPAGTLLNRRVFAYWDSGAPDGIKTDRAGNLYGGLASGWKCGMRGVSWWGRW